MVAYARVRFRRLAESEIADRRIVGHKLRCRVTAHNAAGQASKASDQVLVTS